MIKQHEEPFAQNGMQTVIDDVICNCCGNPIPKDEMCTRDVRTGVEKPIINDYLDINQAWGYFSKHDTELHKCQICEDCCMKIASTFKIPVEVIEYM